MKNPAASKTTPCCSKIGLKRGPWTPQEDEVLATYIKREGEGRWRTLPKRAGLLRCGKSCRLRWMNYLRPSVKRGQIAPDEEDLILRLHRLLGNRWSLIAGRIPGRTDNEIKNYWNTHLSKKLVSQGIDPRTHKPLNNNPLRLHDTTTSMATAKASSSKPIPNNARPSRIAAPQLPNPNPTPPSACENNCNNNSASENSNSNPQSGSGTTHRKSVSVNKAAPFYGYSDGPSYDHYHTGILLSSGGDNVVNLQGLVQDRSGVGLTTSKSINSNGLSPSLEEDEDINHGADDVLSSFLNSLMNEDMFTAQNQIIQQLQLQPQQPPSGNIAAGSDALIPSPARTAFSFGANWDAPLMSTPSAFNHNDH